MALHQYNVWALRHGWSTMDAIIIWAPVITVSSTTEAEGDCKSPVPGRSIDKICV